MSFLIHSFFFWRFLVVLCGGLGGDLMTIRGS